VPEHRPIYRQRNQRQTGANTNRPQNWDHLRSTRWDTRTGILHAPTILVTGQSNSIRKGRSILSRLCHVTCHGSHLKNPQCFRALSRCHDSRPRREGPSPFSPSTLPTIAVIIGISRLKI
jgi:hypothetical protein